MDEEKQTGRDNLAAAANARFSSLPMERPGDLMGGARSTSFARRGPPPPIKINSATSLKDNPFFQKK